MVPILFTAMTRTFSFRPLTGMVLSIIKNCTPHSMFSPPYGDGTYLKNYNVYQALFSPPYGDGT